MTAAPAEPPWISESPGDPWPAEPRPVTEVPLRAELARTAPEQKTRLRPGGGFILDAPDTVPAVWGEGDDVLWARGEALMLVGGPGVGKTTVAGQLVRGRLGLASDVLGLSVRAGRRRVLYLAMDRPQQIARGLRRLFTAEERHRLDERLSVWVGPPPADLAQSTHTLVELAQSADADTVVIDSLKDAALGLTDDQVGAAYNRARQLVIAAGIEVLELHHQVKRGANGTAPNTLADVYGSAWLTAGAGSVVLLAGSAGDSIVELRHLKQPAGDVGPLRVIHDHTAGTSSIWHGTDLLAMVCAAPAGLTAKAAAQALFSTDKPSPSDEQKARRRLDALVKSGHLRRQDGRAGGPHGSTPTTWHDASVLEPPELA
ncbi:AAA family ATPase [Blastococcus sp. KM273128]|uniref:AAA family ATPase n=1 Tax=Blastococcus sp. KM273128 TaxID=2570314 RepID=UPI001F1DD876|nr:AAA family ATPase [Blastococcus sp. KM273128]MCF6745104.1 AAA family ATPase [Blastococcus sp. KM273128]